MAKSLNLVFKNEEGKTVRFSIPEPQEPVDVAEVNAVMDLLIEKEVFTIPLTEKVSARLTENTYSDIALF